MDTIPPDLATPTVSGEYADDRVAGALIGGRYRIIDRIADGATGAIYLAEHEALHRRVALKFLHDGLAGNSEVAARFAIEAVAAARIAHPNVIAVHDSGVDERGRCFLAMEYCEGEELRAVLHREAPLARHRALDLARQIAAALDHAHSMGIVHRDIKPENVLIQRVDGRETVKVIDFGIAKMHQPTGPGGPALTRTGYVLGTPEYMAPEQGLGGTIDHRADLYAFAIVVYEMLVGRRPFDDDDVTVLIMRHVNAQPPSPSSALPSGAFSRRVDEVFDRALAKRARDRFTTAREFVDALERALYASPTSATGVRVETSREAALAELSAYARSVARLATARWNSTAPAARATAVICAAIFLLAAGASMRRVPPPVVIAHPQSAHSTPVARSEPARTTTHALSPREHEPLASVMARVAALRARPELATRTARQRQRAALSLEAMRLEHPDDPALAYALGALYARDLNTAPQSAAAYRDALRAAPSLASDPTLLGDVVRAFATAPARAATAEALLRGPLSDSALDAMVDLCVRDAPGRARVAALLAEPSFAARLDATQTALLALTSARSCEARRDAIETLSRVADARALPPLRRVPTGTGCGFLGLARCNGCLGDAVTTAVRAIEARAPDAGS